MVLQDLRLKGCVQCPYSVHAPPPFHPLKTPTPLGKPFSHLPCPLHVAQRVRVMDNNTAIEGKIGKSVHSLSHQATPLRSTLSIWEVEQAVQ